MNYIWDFITGELHHAVRYPVTTHVNISETAARVMLGMVALAVICVFGWALRGSRNVFEWATGALLISLAVAMIVFVAVIP